MLNLPTLLVFITGGVSTKRGLGYIYPRVNSNTGALFHHTRDIIFTHCLMSFSLPKRHSIYI